LIVLIKKTQSSLSYRAGVHDDVAYVDVAADITVGDLDEAKVVSADVLVDVDVVSDNLMSTFLMLL
jgi:hypothetical protein